MVSGRGLVLTLLGVLARAQAALASRTELLATLSSLFLQGHKAQLLIYQLVQVNLASIEELKSGRLLKSIQRGDCR